MGEFFENYSAIEVTSAQFIATTNAGQLIPGQLYIVTDIENGLLLTAINNTTFGAEGAMAMLAPNYSTHQQYLPNDGAIANGAIVTWGGYYWQNVSGGPVTPDLPSDAIIDSDDTKFERITKSEENGYQFIVCNVVINPQNLSILEFTDNYGNSVNNFVLNFFGLSYENLSINNSNIRFNDGWAIFNNRVVSNDSGAGRIMFNKSISTPAIRRCEILPGSAISNNAGVGTLDVTYIENCNNVTGEHLHLSYRKNILIDGGSTLDENDVNNLSFGEDISITGDSNFIASGYLDSSSFERRITITGQGNEFNSREYLDDSGIEDFIITCDNFFFGSVRLERQAVLSNFSTSTNGRKIHGLHVLGRSFDFTGFDRDIIDEQIIGNKGVCTVNVDFSVTPLSAGNSILQNFIPKNARLVSAALIVEPDENNPGQNTLSGSVGAKLQAGLETADESYILGATTLASVTDTIVNTFSNKTDAHKSILVKAVDGDITAGKVSIVVDFVFI